MAELAFDWDQWNVQKNEEKHGVSRLEAESAFYDPRVRLFEDRRHSSARETRYILYGRSLEARVDDGRLHSQRRKGPGDHGTTRFPEGEENL